MKDLSWKTYSSAILAAGILGTTAGLFIYKQLNRYVFKGKVVLITGGSRGLGLVLARELAAKGAKLAICARSVEQLVRAKNELELRGAEVLALTVDVREKEEVDQMIEDIVNYFGRLDVVINNAGIIQVAPYEDTSIADYEDAMATNFWGPLFVIRAAVPYLKRQKQSKIVNISSIGGKVAVPHLLPYVSSKFALTGFSEGLHAELKKDNIDVTTIIPHLMTTGSPINVTVKGQHKKEYAWFKVADSSPLMAQKVEIAAAKIIDAIENNNSEVVLSGMAKLSTLAVGIAPGLVADAMVLANKVLPNPTGENVSRTGLEAESRLSNGTVAANSDEEAVKNNEL